MSWPIIRVMHIAGGETKEHGREAWQKFLAVNEAMDEAWQDIYGAPVARELLLRECTRSTLPGDAFNRSLKYDGNGRAIGAEFRRNLMSDSWWRHGLRANSWGAPQEGFAGPCSPAYIPYENEENAA